MKDIHCHLLPGIDDGSKSFEESISILKELEKQGTTDIVLTPHYIEKDDFSANNQKKLKLLKELKEKAAKENIKINLYLGNEIFINENIEEQIKNKEIYPINNTRYLLIELPMMNYNSSYKIIFSNLIYSGYKVILAHPERYYYVMNNINILDELLDLGVILQGNYGSLVNQYGKKSNKTLRKLLRQKKISLLAGDIHHSYHLKLVKKGENKLKWFLSKKYIEDITKNNFDKIINDKDI